MQITTVFHGVHCIPEATDNHTSRMAFVTLVRSTELGLMANVTCAIGCHGKDQSVSSCSQVQQCW